MIIERIRKLRSNFNKFGIDGYIIPKNDDFFSEYSQKDHLKTISNFTGSAGFAVILKKKNYLFVDGRYTIQAKIESGTQFQILKLEKIINCRLFKNLKLGIDPKLFTSSQVKRFFQTCKIKEIERNLIDLIFKYPKLKLKPFYNLDNNIVGEDQSSKIKKILIFLKKNKLDYIFISAPENVAWLLNIRGYDNPVSPIPNCRLFIKNKREIFLIGAKMQVRKLIIKKKIQKKQIIEPKNFKKFLDNIKKGKIAIDDKTCSIFFEKLFKKKFTISNKSDPIYLMKAVKNKKEINNMIQSHIADGVALTKFLYWIKNKNKKKISEYEAQVKLEKFRKLNKKYLFPSFNTIAGSGKNGAIIHYRAKKNTAKILNKKDIFLCDSGGQYNYGTTDVTRTICFSKPQKAMKNVFTRVLKAHIAVVTANLNKYFNGSLIDNLARKNLKNFGLNYEHGTGHGVGFFLNVHEGPQAISKLNNVKLREGMVLSNEPGYYKEGKFGIRIENLIYVKKIKKNIFFENLTFVPIEKDLINKQLLNKAEKNYLFQYHLHTYLKLSKFLDKNEKKWLASFI
tara:strand:- start:2131 stop:3825 length:1695 start_codon:yes stop_codon:yes gene_type:complete